MYLNSGEQTERGVMKWNRYQTESRGAFVHIELFPILCIVVLLALIFIPSLLRASDLVKAIRVKETLVEYGYYRAWLEPVLESLELINIDQQVRSKALSILRNVDVQSSISLKLADQFLEQVKTRHRPELDYSELSLRLNNLVQPLRILAEARFPELERMNFVNASRSSDSQCYFGIGGVLAGVVLSAIAQRFFAARRGL